MENVLEPQSRTTEKKNLYLSKAPFVRATVSNCVMWCCESWSPRTEELRKLEVARRAMLRKIVWFRQGPEEDWLTWIQRATLKTLDIADKTKVRKWIAFHYKRKWMWGGHVARSSYHSWLHQVTTWHDSSWQSSMLELGGHRALRPSTRRWMKWEDPLRRFCASSGLPQWTVLACRREEWLNCMSAFCKWNE